MKHQIIEKTRVYDGFFKMDRITFSHDLFNGGKSGDVTREVFERGDAVAVLLIDENKKKVILIEQIRPGALNDETSPWLLEVVAGAIDEGETAESSAIREVVEETGAEPRRMKKVNSFYTSPGGTSERIHLFIADVEAPNDGELHGLADHAEDIKVCVMDYGEAFEAVYNGKIQDAKTVIAVQHLAILCAATT